MPAPRPAARIHDPIMHSNANFGERVGAAVGAFVGAAIVVGEAVIGAITSEVGVGVALIAHALLGGVGTIAAFASGGAAIGKWFGGGSSSIQGYLCSSAARTYIGPGMPLAARIGDKVDCDASNMDQGSDSVFVEKLELSRRDDKTLCAGKVAKGCDTVFIGGGTTDLVPPDQLSEDDPAQSWTLFVVDWGGALVGLAVSGLKVGWKLAGWAPELIGFGLKAGTKTSEVLFGKEALPTRILSGVEVIYGAGKGVKGINDAEEVAEKEMKVVSTAAETGSNTAGVAIKEGEIAQPKPTYNNSPAGNARRDELQRRLGVQPKSFWGTRPTVAPQ